MPGSNPVSCSAACCRSSSKLKRLKVRRSWFRDRYADSAAPVAALPSIGPSIPCATCWPSFSQVQAALQPSPVGECHGAAGRQVQFLLESGEVVGDGPFTDSESPGDGLVVQSVGDEPPHLALAREQR